MDRKLPVVRLIPSYASVSIDNARPNNGLFQESFSAVTDQHCDNGGRHLKDRNTASKITNVFFSANYTKEGVKKRRSPNNTEYIIGYNLAKKRTLIIVPHIIKNKDDYLSQ